MNKKGSIGVHHYFTKCNKVVHCRPFWAIMVLFLIPLVVHAQWRVGVIGGGTINHYTSDNHYLSDLESYPAWGWTIGTMGQYNITEWSWLYSKLSIRGELVYIIKNHEANNLIIRNSYAQFPIMTCLSLGKTKWRWFSNVGIYAGYWLRSETSYNGSHIYNGTKQPSDWYRVDFVDDRDRRTDFGFADGIGCEYNCKRFSVQLEMRCYRSIISSTKEKPSHYNTTFVLQSSICYVL